MKKFLAVIKREYIQRVRAKMFVLSTILLPAALSLFGIVPAIIFSIQTPPLRVAVVDQTRKMYAELKRSLESDSSDSNTQSENASQPRGLPRRGLGTFKLEEVNATSESLDDIRTDLDQRMRARELDGYLILPPDFLSTGKAEFFNRNPGDIVSLGALQSTLNRATREQRLIDAKVDNKTRQELFRPVSLEGVRVSGGSQARDPNASFALVFGVGFVMYLSILMYGQIILGAVIEEKETRIAEILFSSIKPFTLMMGKLVGVSFVALTQLAIWGLAFSVFALFGVGVGVPALRGISAHIPGVPLSHYFFFALFFLLGYFIYATLYALVGSMVTTAQEGGQLAIPIILILAVSFYLFLPVSRSPDSPLAFWVSIFPFTAPVAMVVRIVTQTPPFWQIALSLLIGFGTVLVIMYAASRIYRVGMLMYGKRASIPEAIRWARQA
ncbi:MAG TPA: ABC transporter permease [Pyrinomonadaceae bacterium]|jgi:ABC-2 type transport system permease protein|nr:ABC transporter permease [Pyrinomonadaceae bacterium]